MDDVWTWQFPHRGRAARTTEPDTAASERTGGDGDDEPVLVAVVNGPVEGAMAKDALAEAGIPAYVKQNSLGAIYGLSVGSFGVAEVWVVPPLAERAYDVLAGIGLLPQDPPEPLDGTE